MKFQKSISIFLLLLTLILFFCVRNQNDKINFDQVNKTMQEFIDACNEGNVDKVIEMFTDDGFLLLPNTEMIRGKQAISDYLRNETQWNVELKTENVEIGGSGNTAYQVAEFTITIPQENQEPLVLKNKGTYIWKKQPDGSWKTHVDSWNSSMPMQ